MTREERHCYLREGYERDAKPYIDRLVTIRSIEQPSPTILYNMLQSLKIRADFDAESG